MRPQAFGLRCTAALFMLFLSTNAYAASGGSGSNSSTAGHGGGGSGTTATPTPTPTPAPGPRAGYKFFTVSCSYSFSADTDSSLQQEFRTKYANPYCDLNITFFNDLLTTHEYLFSAVDLPRGTSYAQTTYQIRNESNVIHQYTNVLQGGETGTWPLNRVNAICSEVRDGVFPAAVVNYLASSPVSIDYAHKIRCVRH